VCQLLVVVLRDDGVTVKWQLVPLLMLGAEEYGACLQTLKARQGFWSKKQQVGKQRNSCMPVS
jgi:hypothetical protein